MVTTIRQTTVGPDGVKTVYLSGGPKKPTPDEEPATVKELPKPPNKAALRPSTK